ncbi:MAG: phosphoribosyltransferase [Candidatus Yanofskybacteria bacterium]|nr:phosphoribosyltransferase [Candidatus Yanofskybacteria bacterium]
MPEKIPTNKIKPEEKKLRKEVELEEVAELEEPIKKIIEKIRDRIESGEYGLIIGDDASGRIPTLILGNFIKNISEKKGLDKPNIIFIPGKLNYFFHRRRSRELDKYISEYGATKERRILVVTDTIQSGGSLETLVKLLKKSGHSCDIATIGVEFPDDYEKKRFENLGTTEIISGEYQKGDSYFYPNTPGVYKSESKGVYKKPRYKVSKTLKSAALPEGINPEDVNPESINTRSSRQEIQESINKSRKDTSVVVDHLIDWYESQKQEK